MRLGTFQIIWGMVWQLAICYLVLCSNICDLRSLWCTTESAKTMFHGLKTNMEQHGNVEPPGTLLNKFEFTLWGSCVFIEGHMIRPSIVWEERKPLEWSHNHLPSSIYWDDGQRCSFSLRKLDASHFSLDFSGVLKWRSFGFSFSGPCRWNGLIWCQWQGQAVTMLLDGLLLVTFGDPRRPCFYIKYNPLFISSGACQALEGENDGKNVLWHFSLRKESKLWMDFRRLEPARSSFHSEVSWNLAENAKKGDKNHKWSNYLKAEQENVHFAHFGRGPKNWIKRTGNDEWKHDMNLDYRDPLSSKWTTNLRGSSLFIHFLVGDARSKPLNRHAYEVVTRYASRAHYFPFHAQKLTQNARPNSHKGKVH